MNHYPASVFTFKTKKEMMDYLWKTYQITMLHNPKGLEQVKKGGCGYWGRYGRDGHFFAVVLSSAFLTTWQDA